MKRLLALLCIIPCFSSATALIRSKSVLKVCPNGITVRSNQRCPSVSIPKFSISGGTVVEAGGSITLHVVKTGTTSESSVVSYSTADITAMASMDYAAKSGTLTFLPGDTDKTIQIQILNDSIQESTETFAVNIVGVTNAVVTSSQAIVTITDDDAAPTPNGLLAPLTPVSDNFTTSDGICSHDPITGTCGNYTTGASPDEMGNFRMICGAGQISYNDPIVYPGQPNASPHLHQFYGNLSADGNSTYQSLRQNGGSTCGDPNASIAVNRSGYWMPAMFDGAGHVVKPEYVAIYYKRQPASSSKCTQGSADFQGICVGIPTGLRFVSGYNMANGQANTHALYYCQDSDLGGAHAVDSSIHTNLTEVIPLCPVGARLTIAMGSPDCWDGVHLDSADHRSHMAYGQYVWNGSTSVYQCDAQHPYHIPQMSLLAFYVVDANWVAGKWHFSSDEMVPGATPGTTFHIDYFEAWSPTVRATWTTDCIDGHLQCAGGDLGNGTAILGMGIKNTSGLVPIPARP